MIFECPICDTMVSKDAKICPGCGAIFAGGEEEGAASPYDEIAIKLPKSHFQGNLLSIANRII